MTLRQLIGAVRRSVALVMACVLLGAALAALYGVVRPDRYVSESGLFLSVSETAEGTSRQDTLYLQQRMQSYAAVLASPALGSQVADSLDLDLTGEEVAAMITVSVPADTVLLDVQVQDTSAERAQQIADAAGQEFADLLASLEGVDAGPVRAVDVTTIEPASVPVSPVGGIALLVVAGALAGLVAGVGIALLRAGLDDTVRNGQEVATLGVVHLGTVPTQRRGRAQGKHSPDRGDALRSVRLHLLAAADADPQAGLAVTVTGLGPAADVGGLCDDLAGILAAGGGRVIVVDAGAGGIQPGPAAGDDRPDLIAVLTGAAAPAAALGPGSEAVQFLRGRNGPPDSALLHSPRLAELLADLTRRADVVLVAAPPLGTRPDAEALALASDGVVLVAEPGRTRRHALRRALRTFESLRVRLLGVVLAGRATG